MRITVRIWRLLAVAGGALLMLWPAICNGYPLLYPDSMSYLGDGRPLAKILFLHHATGYSAMRSEIYSLGIFFFHWNVSAWPVVALHALMTSYVIWLVVRSLNAHSSAARVNLQFLALTALVSLTTSLGWYVCLIMPDILGPVLYLAIYLLVFAQETLTAREQWAIIVIAGWAIAAHTTHLMLSVGLCFLLALLLLLRWPPMRGRSQALAKIAAIILLVAGSQMALHKVLYGKATLNGNRMPYLMARVIADGPGRWYLRQHCGTFQWAICQRMQSLPNTDDSFLWDEDGVWASAPPKMQQQLLHEEMPLVLASVRAYPRAQMQRSLANFWQELDDFGLWDFCPNSWMESEIDRVLPGTRARYLHTREAQSRLPVAFFSAVQQRVVMASALMIALCVPILWWLRRWRILGLVAIIVPVVIANAFITAVLSEADSRYQSRVIWLVPLLAGLIVLELVHATASRSAGD
jgi:hypothetical protein